MKTASDSDRNPFLGILDHMLVLLDAGPAHSRDFVAQALLVAQAERFVCEWIATR